MVVLSQPASRLRGVWLTEWFRVICVEICGGANGIRWEYVICPIIVVIVTSAWMEWTEHMPTHSWSMGLTRERLSISAVQALLLAVGQCLIAIIRVGL